MLPKVCSTILHLGPLVSDLSVQSAQLCRVKRPVANFPQSVMARNIESSNASTSYLKKVGNSSCGLWWLLSTQCLKMQSPPVSLRRWRRIDRGQSTMSYRRSVRIWVHRRTEPKREGETAQIFTSPDRRISLRVHSVWSTCVHYGTTPLCCSSLRY